MTITKKQADMIAEALCEKLYNKVRHDVIATAREVASQQSEEYLCVKEVAQILGWHPVTVYKKKDDIGCYVTVGGHMRFIKSQIKRAIEEGRIKSKA